MQNSGDDNSLHVLFEIRNWIRAASHPLVKLSLEKVLPDAKSRMAYQMLDGMKSMEQVRVACKISPNFLLELANKCSAAGLMQLNSEKRRVRLFDLADFGIAPENQESGRSKTGG